MTLTATQLQHAQAHNPGYQTQLGHAWLGYKASHAAIDSDEFAQATADFQAALHLGVDGQWGPATNTAAGQLTLTPEQLQTALVRNPAWQSELGSQWAGNLISTDPVDSPEFAEAVYVLQQTKGLTKDGICGPRTNAAAADVPYVPPEGTEYLLINGQPLACDFKVVSPDETGALLFKHGFYSDPLLLPKLFVLHWDGCYSARSCYDVLCGRNLSVQFMLDADSTVYQGLDPATGTCWHAGTVNRWAWGVEICNPVYPKRQNAQHPRPLSTMQVRGDKSSILGFYPEQIAAAVKLTHWVCDYASIPKQLPALTSKPGAVYNSYFAPGANGKWDVHGFSGVCGHFHQDNNKCDPGMELWAALIASGFSVVEV